MKFRKKPVVIEAEQFGGIAEEHFPKDGYLVDAEGNRMMFMYWPIQVDEQGDAFLTIHTLEGAHRANIRDWIIQGIKGEFYPCKPDIFEATYDRVE